MVSATSVQEAGWAPDKSLKCLDFTSESDRLPGMNGD